jgi:hypothetical protein
VGPVYRSLVIPKLTEDRLTQLAGKIRPVVRNSQGVLHYIKPVDLKNVAFTWSPNLDEEAISLTPVKTIRTLHGYGYYGFFKPSIAEVLAQIPADIEDRVVAFETHGPETADDFYKDEETKKAFDAGFHTAETTLYVYAEPEGRSRFEKVG